MQLLRRTIYRCRGAYYRYFLPISDLFPVETDECADCVKGAINRNDQPVIGARLNGIAHRTLRNVLCRD
ncbi:hypothetical protein B0G76_4075 [Paraburkholderia sp. BL23I1N1]|uniref:hypothetical protein n=1 Tax=Paraburkholderia sp. BL23I1N1 TaxID=1938802 RepID=UPI000E709B52|nr:hypothetical protein [Paraburkholderia sp. BL23I1N1]RKE37798.1 hypothetical protein B0G76_4075 [Paraburkholderia sp. BL23I1N1]